MAVFYLQTHQLSARVQVFVKWVAELFEGMDCGAMWGTALKAVLGYCLDE